MPAGLVVFLVILGIAVIVLKALTGGSDTSDHTSDTFSESESRCDDYVRKRAAEDYARYAQHKAGFVAHGNDIEAARTQAQMDRAMADMIAGSKNSIAKQSYKNAAGHKAGALIHGNTVEAARAQAQMDKAFADMITGSKNSIAKQSYKNAADHKAGALIHGDKVEAARAQARMDKALADMLSGKDY